MPTRQLLVAAAAIAGGLLAPEAAGAAQPVCGQVLTVSVTLEADLECPASGTPALIVGAAGITIDLGGHTIGGDLTVGSGPGIGIANGDRHDGVRIRNGSISGLGRGIALSGATGTRIRDVDIGGVGGDAISVADSPGTIVTDSVVAGRGNGLTVVGSNDLRVVRSTVSGVFGGAISLTGHGAVIEGNALGVEFRRGTVSINGWRNRVTQNVIQGTVQGGQVQVGAGAGNVVARNWIVGSRATSTFPFEEDGIFVSSSARATRVGENISVSAGDDGIDVEDPTARVARNWVTDNADLGIEAVAGASAAGNRAARNGNPAQCTGVPCGPA